MSRLARVRNGGAFTLAEMLVVLSLLAIFAGMVVVLVRGRQDTHALQVSTKDLAAAIRMASTETKAKQRPHRVAFYGNCREFRLEAAAGGTGDYAPVIGVGGMKRRLAGSVRIDAVLRADGEPIEPAPDQLGFQPGGQGFSGRVRLVNRAGETMQIEVMNATGQVNVLE